MLNLFHSFINKVKITAVKISIIASKSIQTHEHPPNMYYSISAEVG